MAPGGGGGAGIDGLKKGGGGAGLDGLRTGLLSLLPLYVPDFLGYIFVISFSNHPLFWQNLDN